MNGKQKKRNFLYVYKNRRMLKLNVVGNISNIATNDIKMLKQ